MYDKKKKEEGERMGFWVVFFGGLCLALGVALGVTRRKRREAEKEMKILQEDLGKRMAAAEVEQKRKKDLVAFLAHDLKTPLTSVVGYLTILDSRPMLSEEERRKFTRVALDKAKRLEELLGEFFDISRMDLRQGTTGEETVQLTLLLEQLCDEFYPIFHEKGLDFQADIGEALTTAGDADRLARVFDNVLRNAVNYSKAEGKVRLTAAKRGRWVQIDISNQGLGIPEVELSNIFNQFYRLDAARSSRTGGAGLGLAIAKEIVEDHGGSIGAESTGEETVFHITLPTE